MASQMLRRPACGPLAAKPASRKPIAVLAFKQTPPSVREASPEPTVPSPIPPGLGMGRRSALGHLAGAMSLAFTLQSSAAPVSDAIASLEEEAFTAYANREFQKAVNVLTDIIAQDPNSPRWREMRAQVLVDGKNFAEALKDFDLAIQATPAEELTSRARLLAGRALAHEGLANWRAALTDYSDALELAAQGGESPDPYVINSRGNCYNSLGMWAEAREDYLVSSQLFQQAKGFRGRGGSTTQRLDGAIFAASNAALMLAQMGDEEGAVKEMERIARRAPGSADMRAALAALYYAQGRQQDAEDQWEFACDKISVGCSKYQDPDWLRRIRRWPPVMAERMAAFISLSGSQGSAQKLA